MFVWRDTSTFKWMKIHNIKDIIYFILIEIR